LSTSRVIRLALARLFVFDSAISTLPSGRTYGHRGFSILAANACTRSPAAAIGTLPVRPPDDLRVIVDRLGRERLGHRRVRPDRLRRRPGDSLRLGRAGGEYGNQDQRSGEDGKASAAHRQLRTKVDAVNVPRRAREGGGGKLTSSRPVHQGVPARGSR
jgi:hypothetical protein